MSYETTKPTGEKELPRELDCHLGRYVMGMMPPEDGPALQDMLATAGMSTDLTEYKLAVGTKETQ